MPVKRSREAPGSESLGIIAGMGELPLAVASEARKKGYRIVAIALQPPADESLRPLSDDFHSVNIGKLGALLSLLKKNRINNVVMAGKVPKKLLYENRKKIVPDLRAVRLLFALKDRRDDTIMLAVVNELERKGIRIHKTTEFTRELMASPGILTRKRPSPGDWKDIRFGWDIARNVGKLDIGQTVVVKHQAVMAVEAIEGTDEAIKRGAKLAGEGAVVIKVSKPGQDMRFDVPAIGLKTLHSMHKSNSTVLAVEAGKCIIIERERFFKEADKLGIVVVGLDRDILKKYD